MFNGGTNSMVPSISDLLNRLESQTFVGRDAELQLMEEQLELNRKQYNLLHFHGISGIGKTALLLRFMKKLSSAQVIYLSPDKELDTPQAFLKIIVQQLPTGSGRTNKIANENEKTIQTSQITTFLNDIASKKPPLLLLFDSFELWKPITRWLFESFIPELSAEVRLISAGRESLDLEWMQRNPWNLLVKEIELKPLSEKSVQQYLEIIGYDESALRRRLVHLTNGIPFAMNLCSKWINENGPDMNMIDFKNIIRLLCLMVLVELDLSLTERSLLEAASVIGKFDKEMLSYITGAPLSYEDFDQFCEIPIIKKTEDGWCIIDGIRNWIQSDFKEYSPELFHTYKRRALEVLHRRWLDTDLPNRRSLFMGNIHNAGNDLLQEYYFVGDESLYDIRTARREDIPTIIDIWRNHHLNNYEFVYDRATQEQLMLEVWDLDPEAIKAFWAGNRIVGFASVVTFTEAARNIFVKNGLYRNYILKTKPVENERLIWIGATADNNDYPALNAIYRYFFDHLVDPCLITMMLPADYDVSALLALGYKIIPWARAITPKGKTFNCLQADFRDVPFYRVVTMGYPLKKKKRLPVQDGAEVMKKLLRSFYVFETDPELFVKVRKVIGTAEEVDGDMIRSEIRKAMKEIESWSERDRLMMRSLELYYIDRIGTNEIVAERLHLSISTYYRYVREGVEKLAAYMLNRK